MRNRLNRTFVIRVLVATTLPALLASCKTTSVSQQSPSCGCIDYFPATNVNTQAFAQEIISEQIYQASGSTLCTGLKQTDIDNADKAARENLAKLISVKVETEEFSKIGSPGYGVTIREYLQNTNLESKLTVQGSYIAHRWHIGSLEGDIVKLDGIGGSAILARGDLFRRGLSFPPFVFEHGLNNASFYLAQSENSLVDTKLLQYFVENGVSKISGQDKQQKYRIESNVIDVKQKSKKDLVLTLQVKIVEQESGDIKQAFTTQGKGVTYKNLSYSALYDRAVDDALHELQSRLAEALK